MKDKTKWAHMEIYHRGTEKMPISDEGENKIIIIPDVRDSWKTDDFGLGDSNVYRNFRHLCKLICVVVVCKMLRLFYGIFRREAVDAFQMNHSRLDRLI